MINERISFQDILGQPPAGQALSERSQISRRGVIDAGAGSDNVFRKALLDELPVESSSRARPEQSIQKVEQRRYHDLDPSLQQPRFQEPYTEPASPARSVDSFSSQPQRYTPKLDDLVKDVQQYAEISGFLSVTPQQVMAAYQTGQSFLADYKV